MSVATNESTQASWMTVFMGDLGYRDLTNGQEVLFGCECGCLIFPMVDTVVYLDRYQAAPGDCSVGMTDCPCHLAPSSVPLDAGRVMWLSNYASNGQWSEWCCSPYRSACEQDSPTCTECGNLAVAYLLAPYEEDGSGGPRWVCRDGFPAPVPPVPALGEWVREPDEFAAARQQAEIMLAAGVSVPSCA